MLRGGGVAELGFDIATAPDGVRRVSPRIDDQPLTALVGQYERSAGYAPDGGYGGLALDAPGLHPGHYLGEAAHAGWTYVLACECGEVGCWPLECRIEVTRDEVVWSAFRQPHRDAWDYAGFGPFVFDRRRYEAAVAALGAAPPGPIP